MVFEDFRAVADLRHSRPDSPHGGEDARFLTRSHALWSDDRTQLRDRLATSIAIMPPSAASRTPLGPRDARWDNPTKIVTLDAKRRLTVPAGLAPASPGDYFDARFDAEEDALVFRRLPGKKSWLAVLKACPVSLDDIPRSRRAPARRRKL